MWTRVFLLLVFFQSLAAYLACIDGQDNVAMISDLTEGNPIQFQNIVIQTYTEKWEPACYKGVAQGYFPGYAVAVSGIINVTGKFDVKGKFNETEDNALLMTYGGKSAPAICVDGVNQTKILPKEYCATTLCIQGSQYTCDLLETPGVYVIGSSAYPNFTIHIQIQHGSLDGWLFGEWYAGLRLAPGNQTLAHIGIVSNGGYIWVGSDDDGSFDRNKLY